jgi:hypothetical protein
MRCRADWLARRLRGRRVLHVTELADLEKRTSTRIDVDTEGTRQTTIAKAIAAGRFWVTRSDPKTLRTELYEMWL